MVYGLFNSLETKHFAPQFLHVKLLFHRLSFQWSHTKVSSTDGKVRSTTLYSIILSSKWKYYFECSHTRVSSTDIKIRTTLYSIMNSITWKYCSLATCVQSIEPIQTEFLSHSIQSMDWVLLIWQLNKIKSTKNDWTIKRLISKFLIFVKLVLKINNLQIFWYSIQ